MNDLYIAKGCRMLQYMDDRHPLFISKKALSMTESNHRQSEYPINPIFLDRWGPRAFDGQPMPESDLLTVLDASRWAPSALNVQPWRFVYVRRDSDGWDDAVALLMEGNQVWAKHAAALVFMISHTKRLSRDGNWSDNAGHAFDSGAAWMAASLQAKMLGYDTHGMGGIHKDMIAAHFNIPEEYTVEMAFAVGKHGSKESLPEELQAREIPSNRKPLNEVVFENSFKG